MPYVMKQHEWDIPEEEQEAALFIREFADRSNEREASGQKGIGVGERAAYEEFKNQFYFRVCAQLDIPRLLMGQGTFGWTAFALNTEGNKLVGWRVEEVHDG